MTNEILESISVLCPRLKKLSLLNCDGCDNNGIIAFVSNFKERLSKNLEVSDGNKEGGEGMSVVDGKEVRQRMKGMNLLQTSNVMTGALRQVYSFHSFPNFFSINNTHPLPAPSLPTTIDP
uniref:Uncharacterized protein n=1 Tax=Panagrolaimus sp. JU765 TaxID=591449 RepID=A0AC34R966_9BILA